jgi:CBS domain-containing protein
MTLIPCTLEQTQPLRVAHAMMEQLAIRHLPIVDDDGSLLGVLSHREVQALIQARGVDPDQLRVLDVAHREPFAVSPEVSLDEVCATMAKERVGCVIALQGRRPIGIFTSTDACAVLSKLLREQVRSEP